MLLTLDRLTGYQIEATDGVIGHVAGVYFDDERWVVRYLIIKTKGWPGTHKVLLAPNTLGKPDPLFGTISSGLTTQQVEDSPSVDPDSPLSRHQASWFDDYYNQARAARGLWEGRGLSALPTEPSNDQPSDVDPHLRSSRELVGCRLHSIDAQLGHVEDLVIDDEGWVIRYLAVDTTNWRPGGHVLIPPRWVDGVRWAERLVDLRLTKEILRGAPTRPHHHPISNEYEDELREYFRLRQKWSTDPRSNETPLLSRYTGPS